MNKSILSRTIFIILKRFNSSPPQSNISHFSRIILTKLLTSMLNWIQILKIKWKVFYKSSIREKNNLKFTKQKQLRRRMTLILWIFQIVRRARIQVFRGLWSNQKITNQHCNQSRALYSTKKILWTWVFRLSRKSSQFKTTK